VFLPVPYSSTALVFDFEIALHLEEEKEEEDISGTPVYGRMDHMEALSNVTASSCAG